jgi:hypothetical protein
MGDRFREFPLWGQFLVVLILLIVAWALVQLLMGIIRALFPLAIMAAVIVVAFNLYDKFKK